MTMASPRTKVVVGIAVAGALLLVVGVIAYEILSGPGSKPRQVKVDPAKVAAAAGNRGAPAIPARPEGEWMPQFKAVYALADGENLRRIPKPFIPQRIEYYRAYMGAAQVQAIPQGPDFYLLDYDPAGGGKFSMGTAWFGQPDVQGMITSVLRTEPTMLTGPRDVFAKQLGGDIVERKGLTPEQKAAGLVDMLAKDLKRNFTLEQQDLDREVIVASGKFVYVAPTTGATTAPSAAASRNRIHIYRGKPRGNGWNTRGSSNFIRMMQNICQTPMVVEGTLGGEGQEWEMDQSAYVSVRGGNGNAQQVDEILANVAAQSQMRFRREHRMIKTWVLADAGTAWPPPGAWPTTKP
jgi:hypothetical protein